MKSGLNTVKPVQRKTLQTEVYQQLCQLILEGNLAPGESITVASIAKAFDVSPMPVREATTRLMAAGALTVVSGRSIGVPKLDKTVFTDLRNVRLELETLCIRWAIANTSAEFKRDIQDKLNAMIAAERAGEVKGFIHANYNFHFTIYRQAGSDTLLEIVSNIWLRINPYFHLLQTFGHYKISNEQHQEIVDGILKDDTDRAVAALKEDINSAYDTMVAAQFNDAGEVE
ncbi:GntR family transcriptional regulator [uncultured Roseovarius sp.]|uniref:GntR family transcriptional regulator n=1 Tax=uncultured Roseovarius sp. TaxID=293344 RepID=UPI0026182C5C|nr:GntR family transcriptional regulator [uncultured Roseovarius sp.]